jgi:cobalt/nickel transport system permease protein
VSCHLAQQLDLLGYGSSCIHRLDSRSKLISAAVFVVCVVSFPKYAVSALVPLLLLPVLIGIFGDVPLCLVMRLLLVASPFAVMVGIFNPLLDPNVWFKVGPHAVSAGWLSFSSIVLRFVLSVSMVLVIIGTTSIPRLLHGLRQLGLPRAFVTQLQFLYRYLFLLIEEGESISRARQVRDPVRKRPSIGTAKQMLYCLLWRSWERANRVFMCMKARGFERDFTAANENRLHCADVVFLVLVVSACLTARFVPLMQTFGEWLLTSLRSSPWV